MSRSRLGRFWATLALAALLAGFAVGSLHARTDPHPQPGRITHSNSDRGHGMPVPHLIRYHAGIQMPACTVCQFNQLSDRTLVPAPTALDGLLWRLLSCHASTASAIAGSFRGSSGRSPPRA